MLYLGVDTDIRTYTHTRARARVRKYSVFTIILVCKHACRSPRGLENNEKVD